MSADSVYLETFPLQVIPQIFCDTRGSGGCDERPIVKTKQQIC